MVPVLALNIEELDLAVVKGRKRRSMFTTKFRVRDPASFDDMTTPASMGALSVSNFAVESAVNALLLLFFGLIKLVIESLLPVVLHTVANFHAIHAGPVTNDRLPPLLGLDLQCALFRSLLHLLQTIHFLLGWLVRTLFAVWKINLLLSLDCLFRRVDVVALFDAALPGLSSMTVEVDVI